MPAALKSSIALMMRLKEAGAFYEARSLALQIDRVNQHDSGNGGPIAANLLRDAIKMKSSTSLSLLPQNDARIRLDRKLFPRSGTPPALNEEIGRDYMRLCGIYLHGEGCDIDYARAFNCCLRIGDGSRLDPSSNALSWYYQGLMLLNGLGEVETDYFNARRHFQRATEIDVDGATRAMAHCMLGEIHFYGLGVESDAEKALSYFNLALNQSVSPGAHCAAQCWLGRCYLEGCGVAAEYAKAYNFFTAAACQEVDPAIAACARYNLGEMFANGWGVERDDAQACSFWELAADNNNPGIRRMAQCQLAIRYYTGCGVVRDIKHSCELFEAAVERHQSTRLTDEDRLGSRRYLAIALGYLGRIYYYGIGIKPNCAKGRCYLEAAACQKDDDEVRAYAQQCLSDIDQYTIGIEPDYLKSHVHLAFPFGLQYLPGDELDYIQLSACLARAAEQQADMKAQAFAHFYLGRLFYYGLGFDRDEKRGIDYFAFAANQTNDIQTRIMAEWQLARVYAKIDQQQARRYLESLVNQTANQAVQAAAQELMGQLYCLGADDEHYEKAFECFLAVANQQHNLGARAMAWLKLGELYSSGQGTQRDLSEAHKYWQLAAEQKNIEYVKVAAQAQLAELLQGQEWAQDHAQARKYFKSVARQQINLSARAIAELELGRMSYYNYFGKPDYSCAREYFDKAHNQSANPKARSLALFFLGLIYFNGQGIERDWHKGREYLEQVAKQDDTPSAKASAQLQLGFIFYNGTSVRRDKVKAHEYFLAAAEQQVNQAARVESQYELGQMYYHGDGIGRDRGRAIDCFEAVVEHHTDVNKVATAQVYLGWLLLENDDNEEDQVKARAYLESAAAQQKNMEARAEAQWLLGDIYFSGKGIARDLDKARNYFKAAAKQQACTRAFAWSSGYLAHMYLQGNGVQKNIGKAIKYVKQAAEQGLSSLSLNTGQYESRVVHAVAAEAHFLLGKIYYEGNGVATDHAKASKHFREAILHENEQRGGLPTVKAQANFLLGKICHKRRQGINDYSTAKDCFETVIRVGEAFLKAAANYYLADLYLNPVYHNLPLGWQSYNEKRAIEYLEAAANQDDNVTARDCARKVLAEITRRRSESQASGTNNSSTRRRRDLQESKSNKPSGSKRAKKGE